jgi:hypothetical protein
VRAATVLQAIDVFGRLRCIDLNSGSAPPITAGVAWSAGNGRLIVLSGGSARTGVAALRVIAPRVPLLWPLLPFSLLMPRPSAAAPTSPAIP